MIKIKEILKEIERLKGIYSKSKSSKLYINGYLRALRDLQKFINEVKKDGKPTKS